jgi:hypothetical protein
MLKVDDSELLQFDDLISCGYKPNSEGEIECYSHDAPLVDGSRIKLTQRTACEDRKQWLEKNAPGDGAYSARLIELMKREELPFWIQRRWTEVSSDAKLAMIQHCSKLAPVVQLQIIAESQFNVRHALAQREDLVDETMLQLAADENHLVQADIAKQIGVSEELEEHWPDQPNWLAGVVAARLKERRAELGSVDGSAVAL